MPLEYKIEVFVPESHSAALMEALSGAGVGRIGSYEHCFSITSVQGFWRPLEGAEPYEGRVGEISQAPEHKLEVSCAGEMVTPALLAIRKVHPYEAPVVNVIALANSLFPVEGRSL
jgi:hypothetical protein